jgi:serine/threonine-protein kinase RsbW
MSAPRIGDRPGRIIGLRFAATRAEVRGALIAVDRALDAAGFGRELRDRTQIALAEACNNIVEHAYGAADDGAGYGGGYGGGYGAGYGGGGTAGDAMITLDVAADRGGLQVTLRDRGGAMPGGRVPVPDLPAVDPGDPLGLPEGGFGWPLLRGMARALSLSRQNGQNILRFRLPMSETGADGASGGRNAM